ncbi:MAG: glycosyltransferase family 4 protein [Terriglobia bacterium]
MRILHLDSGREMRGGQWQALRLHEGLAAAGHDSLLLARADSPLFALARERGAAVQALRPLRLAQQSRSFDLVHAHDARSHTLGALFARAPLVVSRRVAFAVRDGALSRWKYRRPALFLAVSHFVARQLHDAGVDERKIAVVYDGVPVPAQTALGDEILIPFTDDPAKGMDLALAEAKRAGVTARVTRNLSADLPTARALVYLSQSEGLGSGILLAMAHGVTVIASNTGGVPELIEDGVNGILVANEAGAVATAFPRIGQQLGDAARLTVMRRFTVAHMLTGTVEAYERVLANA